MLIFALMVSYDLQVKTWHSWFTFLHNNHRTLKSQSVGIE